MESLLKGCSAHRRKRCVGLSAEISEGSLGVCSFCRGISCKCLKLGEMNPGIGLCGFKVESFSQTLNLLEDIRDTGTERLQVQQQQKGIL